MAENITRDTSVRGSLRKLEHYFDKRIFRGLPGWNFDEKIWIDNSLTNQNFKLPELADIDLSAVPTDFYQSGIDSGNDLILDEIRNGDLDTLSEWTPFIKTGRYFTQKTPMILNSWQAVVTTPDLSIDDSVALYLKDGTLSELSKRTLTTLAFRPKPSTPIDIRTLQRNEVDFGVESLQEFVQVSSFRGVALNGKEQDGNDPLLTDRTKREFKVQTNFDEDILGLTIDSDNFAVASEVGTLTLDGSPYQSRIVEFSRPDIFRAELPFAEWHERHAGQGDPLSFGDYTIGYLNSIGEDQGVKVFLAAKTFDYYGTVSYCPAPPASVIFNQDVLTLVEDEEPIDAGANSYGQIFYLRSFPALDLTSFSELESGGDLDLDTSSLSLFVGGIEWTRVVSLDDVEEGDDQDIFELDSLFGVIRFGNGGLSPEVPLWGNRPEGAVTVTYTRVPLIRYEPEFAEPLYTDNRLDLDSLTNGLRSGFLVLDNKESIPFSIELTTTAPRWRRDDGLCIHGSDAENQIGLLIPPTQLEDSVVLRARVYGRGNPLRPLSNIPVQFISPDGLLVMVSPFSVTDGDGYAYTEAYGKSLFSEYVYNVFFYNPYEGENNLNTPPEQLALSFSPLDPIISDSLIAPDGSIWNDLENPDWEDNVLILEEYISGDPEDIYLFITSVPGLNIVDDYTDEPAAADGYPVPYDSIKRDGGLSIVWTYSEDGNKHLVHPVAIENIGPNQTKLIFDRKLPEPFINGPGMGLLRNLIMSLNVVINRTSKVYAKTLEPVLTSNELTFALELDETMRGQWKLPELHAPDSDGFSEEPEIEDLDSSRISTATFLSPNDFAVDHIENALEETIVAASTGATILIKGTSFPTDPELKLSVFIVKLEGGQIVAVKSITSDTLQLDSTTIHIESLPIPPGNEPGDYVIAIGGYLEDRTIVPLTIN